MKQQLNKSSKLISEQSLNCGAGIVYIDDTVSDTFLAWLVVVFIVMSIVAPTLVMIYMFHCSLIAI